MLLLVSGATATVRQLQGNQHLGHLLTPDNGNSIDSLRRTELPIACDNSAFVRFDPAKFCKMLSAVAGKRVLFVAAPDVVGDARATADQFYRWQPIIRALGLPVALVLQDGQEQIGVPWNMLDVLFIGGSTAFKLGPVAARIAREGKQRGKWVHMGRVNTRQRFRYAYELGCDSVDGTGFSRFPDMRIPMALRWLDDLERQPSLLLAA